MTKANNPLKSSYLLLHNIRSVHNVGSIFRTADAAGIKKIFLTGYTPTPVDRFGREVKELSKVSLGGELSVEWEYFKTPGFVLKKLETLLEPIQIIGIEQDKKAQDYKKVKVKQPVLFIVGNEVEGIPASLLSRCDVIAEIPMKGKKESLNVGVSLGIALFRMLNI
ncbi:MAG: TrmH family RNA methyltransferase [Patescibacteria group bacterium]